MNTPQGRTRRTVFITGAVGAIGALAVAVFFLRASGKMPDFEVYWRAAARAAAAEPLYRAEDQHYQFKYLPAFAIVAIPLSTLPLRIAKPLWFMSSVSLLVLLLGLSMKLPPERRKSVPVLVAITIVALGKFYGHELVLGQVNLLFVVLVTGALLAVKAGREALAGLLVALTIVIKPYGIILLPWIIARRQAASALAACLGIAVVFLLPATLYGIKGNWALHQDWWRTVNETTDPNLLNNDNVSLAAMYTKWVAPGQPASSLAIATAGSLLVVAVLVFRGRRGVVFPEGLEAGLLLTLIPLLSPQGWDYVLLISTPAIVYLANYEDRLPGFLRPLTIAAVATMGLSLFDVMGRAAYQRFMSMSIITVCALVIVVALSVLRQRRIA